MALIDITYCITVFYQAEMAMVEKSTQTTFLVEDAGNGTPVTENLVYDNDEEEPEVHLRTCLALAAMFLLNLVQVFGLQGPPAVVRESNCISLFMLG